MKDLLAIFDGDTCDDSLSGRVDVVGLLIVEILVVRVLEIDFFSFDLRLACWYRAGDDGCLSCGDAR